MQLETASDFEHLRRVGDETQSLRSNGGPGASLGVLHPRRAAAWRAGSAQLRKKNDLRGSVSAGVSFGHGAAGMKMGTVVRTLPRSTESELKSLATFGVATVHEAMGRTGLMKPYMRP